MNKIIRIIIICCLCSITLISDESDESDLINYLNAHDYDIDQKSYKGWIRVFNNEEYRKKYGFNKIAEEEILMIIKILKDLDEKKITGRMK